MKMTIFHHLLSFNIECKNFRKKLKIEILLFPIYFLETLFMQVLRSIILICLYPINYLRMNRIILY